MQHSGKLRFGPFEFDPPAGELRKHGIRIKLQTKPLAMLSALVEKPGEVVPREELRIKLWPEEPFLDYEAGLNTAAKRLRDALSDSADEPRYIETIPRTGYRFIAPLETPHAPPPSAPVSPPRRFPLAALGLGSMLACAIAALGWLWLRPAAGPGEFRQVNFRKGQVWSARFAPDGQTILYTLQSGASRRVFATNLFGPESREITGAAGILVSVSKRGEMALLRYDGLTPLGGGTLWRMPVNGGGAVEVDRNVFSADWPPDGSQLALARAADGSVQLEYPPGKILYKTSGYLSSLRFRPDGAEIAFAHHPLRHDDAGSVEVVDLAGRARVLSAGWSSLSGLAWHPDTGELLFAASRAGQLRSIHAIGPRGGTARRLSAGPGNLSISDIWADGRALISRGSSRLEMAAGGLGAGTPSDISWLDWSSVKDVSRGGELVLFEENGDGVAGQSVVFVHKRATGESIRLGPGMAMSLGPGATEALVLDAQDRTRLRMVPIGPGKPRELLRSGLVYQWARLAPSAGFVVALASRGAEPLRLHRVDLASGEARPLAPPGMVRNIAISPDGREVAALWPDGKLRLFPSGGVIPTGEPLAPILWTAAGIHVQHTSGYTVIPGRVSVLDPETGRLRPFATLDPGDSFGVNAITRVVMAPDAAHWAFSFRRSVSDLYVSDMIR